MRFNIEKHLQKIAEKKAKVKEKKKAKKKRQKEKIRELKKIETHKRALKKRREQYKPIHIKNLRHRQNQRYYKKKRAKELEEHRLKGDVYGFYRIIITKNYEQVNELSYSWWMLTAYDKFNKYVSENNSNVICEKIIAQSNKQNEEPIINEILLLKKINPNEDDGVRELRNEYGTFIEHKIINNNKYAIIAKQPWYIPETYNVYGYNPVTDRKTGRWIFDNIINKDCTKDNLKNIFMCDNKIIIQYNSDFDFITCKTPNECIRLYNGLQQATDPKNKYIIYSGFISESHKTWLYNQLEEKTGWNRTQLYKNRG
jgi:hypothetical protein